MKRFITAISILLLIFSACIAENIYLEKSSEKITNILHLDNDKNGEFSTEQLYKAIDIWNENRNYYSIFINHSKLDEITYRLNSLPYLYNNSNYEYEITKNEILMMINEILEYEKFSLSCFI